MKGIEQGRASFAYECVEKAIKLIPKNNHPAYKAYVKKFPTLVKTNGLGAALAFVLSKRDKIQEKKGYVYHILYEQIAEWFPKSPIAVKLEGEDLCKYIVGRDSFQYRVLTTETLALFNWLRRFADGMIEGEDIDNG